jgi:hypothetical protein
MTNSELFFFVSRPLAIMRDLSGLRARNEEMKVPMQPEPLVIRDK